MTELTITVGDQDFNFKIDNAHINKFLNSIANNNKVAPMYNLLTSTVQPEQRQELEQLIKNNSLATLEIGGALMEEVTPELNITVKKR